MRLLISWLFIVGLIHRTTSKPGCSQKCSGVQSKFKYGKGSSYTYNYESQTKVQLVGNSNNAPNVNLKATVIISVLDTCDFVLQLNNVKIEGPSTAQVGFDLAKDLEKSPLAFGFDNGVVQVICPEDSESHDVLNIKRGILSAFQIENDFDAEDSYEHDVSGSCPTKHVKQVSGDTISVTKRKDLHSCRNHLSMYTSTRMVPYSAISKNQNAPYIKATQECSYKIKQNVLNEVKCQEKHNLLPPFGDPKTGAGVAATVTSQLTLGQQGKASVKVKEGKRQPLTFNDQRIIWRESKEAAAKARNGLKVLCDTSSKDVRPESPFHFTEFIYQLKSVILDDLRAIGKEAKNSKPCPNAANFFVDAVAQCGTTACVIVVTELLVPKTNADLPRPTPIQTKLLTGNLAFTAHPTKAGLAAITKVLADLPPGGFYAATAFANAHCNQHEGCQESAEPKAFVQKYLSLLSKVSPSKKQTDNAKNLEVVRALGNLGHFSDGISERLKIAKADAHNDIKLAAIQSVRRAPCTTDLENSLLNIYTDKNEDVEIRLNAYLVLIQQCASKRLISQIANVTQDVKLNQIGSFVQSHFKSLRNSKDPSKNKHVFSKAHLHNKFRSQRYRHSQFCHSSNFNHKLNLGYHTDSALIFTPDSTLPKQAFLNLTVDLFGREFNVFEVGIRTEFLDEAADLFFGPEGYFTSAARFYAKEDRKIQIKNPKIAEFQNEYNKRRKPSAGLDLFGYLRILGDEVAHGSAYGIPVLDKLQRLINPAAAANFLTTTKSTTLNLYRLPFDQLSNFPSISGFPLRISFNASIAINLEIGGKVNLADAPNGNAEVNLVLKPSAASHASTQLAVYVGTVKNGVSWSRVGHSSTSIGFSFKYSGHDSVTAKLELPKDKQELLNIESHVYSIVNDIPIEEKGVVANRGQASGCTPKKWADKYGLKLCTNFAYPNSSNVPTAPSFPLTGPLTANLYIEKADPKLTSYDLTASWKANKAGRDIIFLFDTPNTQINRQTKFTTKYERQKSLDMEYKSPSNHLTAKGTLQGAGPDNTAAVILVGVNGKVYDVKGNIKRTGLPNDGRKYTFDGDVKGADKKSAGKVKGNMEIQPGKKVRVEGDVTELFDKPIIYKGGYEKDRASGKYAIEHDLRGPWGLNRVKGDVNFKSLANLDYSFDSEHQKVPQDATPHKIGYSHKHSLDRASKTLKLTANSKLTSTKFPAANIGYDLIVDKTADKLQIKAKTIESGKDALTYEQLTNIKPNEYVTNSVLKHAKAAVDEKFVVSYRNKLPKDLETAVKWNSGSSKKDYEASFTIKRPKAEGYEGDYNLIVKAPGKEYKAVSNVKQGAQPGQLQTNTEIQYAPDKKINIKSTYKGNRKDFEVKSSIQFPGAEPLDFSESHKITPQGTKLTSAIKKGGKGLYDINLDLTNVGDTKKNVKATIKSPVQNVDVSFDGVYEKLPLARRIQGTIKRDNKEYSKTDILVPNSFKYHEEKQAKASFTWALGDPSTKEINFDLKTTKAGPAGIDHEGNFKIAFPNANYRFEVKRRQGENVITNFTIYKTNAPLLQLNVGRTHRSLDKSSVRGNVDVTLRSFAPMTPRDLSGAVTYEFSPKRYKAGLALNDAAKKQRANADFDATVLPGGYDKSLSLSANNYEAKLKNLYSRRNDGSVEVKGDAIIKDAGQKDQSKFAWSLLGNINKFQGQVETPYPTISKISVSGDSAFDQNKGRGKYSFLCGQTKINADYNAEFADKFTLVNVSLDTSFEAVKKARYSVKRDSRSGTDLDFKFDLNDIHRLGTVYKRSTQSNGDEKWVTNLAAKLGKTIDWESNLDSFWNNAQGKYVTKNLVRTTATNKYRTDVDFNSKTNEVKINMENVPGIKPPVTGQAKKIGDNEYEIKLSDASGPNKGVVGFKLTAPSQKFRLETEAFKSSYEATSTDKEWSVGGELVPDLKTKKTYGLKYGLKTPSPTTGEANLQIGYPERKIDVYSKCLHEVGGKMDQSVGVSYNLGKREHTVLRYLLNRGVNAPTVAEIHLTDPSLPQGLHLESKYVRQGDYENEDANFQSTNEISLKYSKDPNRQLTVKRENKREVTNKRGKISSSLAISHPASSLNHKIWNSYLLEPCEPKVADCQYAFSLGASYPDQSKAVRQYSVDITRSPQSLNAGVSFDKKKYALVRKRGTAGQASYTISKDDKELYQITGESFRTREKGRPAVSLSIVKKPENTAIFRASASLDETDFASLKLYHDENGKEVKDIDGVIKLKESNLLHIKYYKRPGLTEAIQSTIEKYVPKQLPKKEDLPSVLVGRESIGKDMVKELQPMLDAWDKEEDQIASELQITSGKLGSAIKEQIATISNALSAAIEQTKAVILKIGAGFKDIFSGYAQAVKEAISKLPELTKNILPALKDAYNSAAKRFNETYENIKKVLNEIYQGPNVKPIVDPVLKALRDAKEAPLYKKLIEILKNLRQALSGDQKGSGPVSELLQKAQSIRQQRYKQVLDFLDQTRKAAANNPDYKDSVDLLNAAYAKAEWFVNYAQPGQKVAQVASGLVDSYRKPETHQLYNKSADGSVVTINLPLYHHFNSLCDVASALTPDRLESTFLEIKDTAEGILDDVRGDEEKRGGLFDDSKALVVGEQSYVTFDGELRALASDCTYLLAKDFIDSRFSVLVKMEKAARKSIIVQFDDDNFEIDYNNAVTINDKSAELPYNNEDRGTPSKVRIIREDDYIVTLQTFNGLKVVCNSFNHICSIILSARYRGKTNGLLGQNDGEPHTDLVLPNGKLASKVDEYLQSWATQPACVSSPNKAIFDKIDDSHIAADHCDRIFGGNHHRSPYSRCKGLNSEEFSLLCKRDMLQLTKKEKDENKHNSGVCQATAAFLTACDMNVDLPEQCLQCKVGSNQLDLHKTLPVSAKDLLKQVDVIFIVDNRQCLAPIQKILGGIAQKVESNLQKAGYNSRFGVVGINGKGLHETPTFHTGKGSVSFAASDVQAAISKFSFGDPAHIQQNQLDVIDFVSEHYPFRPASRKLITLFTCSSCSALELSYYDLQTKLLGQSYSLHIVTTRKIELSGGSKENYIGFDAHTIIKQDLKDDPKARENLVEPHDSCTVLAQETNGTVYSIADKNNLSPISASLATALTKTAEGNECSHCECTSHDFFPKTSCLRCHVPKPVALTTDQSGFLNNPFQKIAKLGKTD